METERADQVVPFPRQPRGSWWQLLPACPRTRPEGPGENVYNKSPGEEVPMSKQTACLSFPHCSIASPGSVLQAGPARPRGPRAHTYLPARTPWGESSCYLWKTFFPRFINSCPPVIRNCLIISVCSCVKMEKFFMPNPGRDGGGARQSDRVLLGGE